MNRLRLKAKTLYKHHIRCRKCKQRHGDGYYTIWACTTKRAYLICQKGDDSVKLVFKEPENIRFYKSQTDYWTVDLRKGQDESI